MKKKIIIISIIAVPLIVIGVFSMQKRTDQQVTLDSTVTASTTDSEIIEPYYPANFFSFEYEQDAFHAIHDQALKLSASNPVRYCGVYFYDEYNVFSDSKFIPSAGEIFDCKEFGTGGSIVKRVSHSSEEGKGPDEGLNLKTESTYSIGKYKITESDIGDTFTETTDTSCKIKITDGSKEIFHLESDEYSCGVIGSVEHNGKALLMLNEPSSGGNSYAGRDYYLFYDGVNLHDLGSLMRQNGGSEDFWVQNGDFVFWVYDGRYEDSYRGSHNASTYAFIPRVFKIGSKNGIVEITEGPSVSSSIKQIYQHQLNAIRESFANAMQDEKSHGQEALDPFVAYRVGMSRYLLSGTELTSELNKIATAQKDLALEAPYNGDSVVQLYSDIKSGVSSKLK